MSWFDSQDKERFKKIGVESLLDLSLLLPKTYENNFLSTSLRIDFDNVLDVTVLSKSDVGKFLKLRFFSHNLDQEIVGIIFHPKPFHKKIFAIKSRIYIRGKIEHNYNTYSIIQPKIIKNINIIDVKYKNCVIKNLVDKYISKTSLEEEGLDKKTASIISLFHNPTISFLNNFQKNGYNKEELFALKYVEIYNYLKKLSSKKRKYLANNILNGDYNDFLKTLPFSLTNDQKKSIHDIQKDFKSKYASKRVVMGDVGCGKTIVMLASTMMAYPLKSILMAPTSILANQIYNEAKKFLPSFVKITLVTSKTQEEDLSQYDFIIGTHALMYRKLPECDLVMIDEQHRFGVNQREFIKKLVVKDKNKRVHFLQFSATPIPRTMAMINSSLVDYSFIKQMPYKKNIMTKIIDRENFKDLLLHIKKEIENHHQIIIVYPLVKESETIKYQSIDEAKEYWLKRFENVFVTFGKDKDKDKILEDFRDKGDLLISTTVIEVGISLPRLSTIVIVGAERLGFASLHQIRGRVSRTGLKGYCFLYTNNKNSKRLKEFAKTTSGFDIAELDLKFRQSGDIISGKNQSGQQFYWIDLSSDEFIIKQAKERLERFQAS